jgi:hypothetical protein
VAGHAGRHRQHLMRIAARVCKTTVQIQRRGAHISAMLSKHVVLYRVGDRDCRCGKCRHFIPPAACALVEGQITAQGKCEHIDLSRLSNLAKNMDTIITVVLEKRRSMERALDDLRAKIDRHPEPDLARMVAQLEAEIADRAVAQLRRV